jgi:hypothetical protein
MMSWLPKPCVFMLAAQLPQVGLSFAGAGNTHGNRQDAPALA